MRKPERANHSGQGLTEYGLIGVCVLALAIPALMFLGNSVQGIAGSMLSSAPPPNANPSTSTPSLSPPLSNATSSVPGRGVSVTTNNGTIISLPDYPQNLTKTVSAMGANGTTELLASSLSSLIEQLQDTGQLNPQQAASLAALANQGHQIALIEQLYETQMAQSGYNATQANRTLVEFQGRTIQLGQLVDQIGWLPSGVGFRPQAQTFIDLYDQAMRNGSLNDPVVRQSITILKDQILNVANGVETAANPTFNAASSSAGNMITQQLNWIPEIDQQTGSNTQQSLTGLASATTHQDSATICNTGGSQDSGTHCSN